MFSTHTILSRRAWLATFCFYAAVPHTFAQETASEKTPVGTTVQLPTFGVAIDADGLLSVSYYRAPGRLLHARRLAAARTSLSPDVAAWSPLRKISLVRLERALKRKLAAGEKPNDAMRNLAGLQRLQYVFCYPAEGDIVLAGPAEGWIRNSSGRTIGIRTGRPVVLLEDLLVALRAYPPGTRKEPFIGCTISPDPEGLTRLVAFQRTIPRAVPQRGRNRHAARIAQGVQNSLGLARIEVFGVSNRTHFARVLIEADYRMKRIGTGLEPPPIRMATFISSLRGARHETLQRWWFVPDYERIKVTHDGLGFELVGAGVQLLGQDRLIGSDGSLAVARPRPNKASRLFTQAFTRKFGEITAVSPVYAQLRNMVDLTVAAALIRRENYFARAGATLGVLADESGLPTETYPEPRGVACAVNSVWKGNRLFTAAGGGVSIRAKQALSQDRLLADHDGALAAAYGEVRAAVAEDRWWWD